MMELTAEQRRELVAMALETKKVLRRVRELMALAHKAYLAGQEKDEWMLFLREADAILFNLPQNRPDAPAWMHEYFRSELQCPKPPLSRLQH